MKDEGGNDESVVVTIFSFPSSIIVAAFIL
jgi:hypothetical protein